MLFIQFFKMKEKYIRKCHFLCASCGSVRFCLFLFFKKHFTEFLLLSNGPFCQRFPPLIYTELDFIERKWQYQQKLPYINPRIFVQVVAWAELKQNMLENKDQNLSNSRQ